jgi:aldose 1-epimerase
MRTRPFGHLPDGTEITEVLLTTPSGISASILTFGCIVRDLIVPLAGKEARRVVLGYPSLDGYLTNLAYLGATVGRYASRISKGRLPIAGVYHQLTLNDGENHLHGGVVGFSHRPWRLLGVDENAATLALVSPDGDQGYPGTVEIRCVYRLIEPATLRVVMTASTDAPTAVNLAHHSYFSLTPGRPICDHRLRINADYHVPFDSTLIPTGEIRAVAGTHYDFRAMRPIEDAEGNKTSYDSCFVLNRSYDGLLTAASLEAPDGALTMEVHTTEPCLVFYDGAKLSSGPLGLDCKPHFPHAGLCLEPIKFPDSANHPGFPQALLKPSELYRQVTEYRFRTDH